MMRRRRQGFTLIELLIVVVIIGILAAIAIPKFKSTKGKANFAAMRSDLKNLMTAQEAFFYDSSRYASALTSLTFNTTRGVVITLDEASPTGWAASATHPESYPLICRVFVGTATAIAPATQAGEVACQ